jgi:hypothetical protein
VLTCIARVIGRYHVEAEVAASLDLIYQRLRNEGFIEGDH